MLLKYIKDYIIEIKKLYNINIAIYYEVLGVVKRNPLFFHSISCKNNDFFLLHLIYLFKNIVYINTIYKLEKLMF